MGMNPQQVRVIPVHRQRIANHVPLEMPKSRVCAYCRVSNEEGQLASFELQVSHYEQFIKGNERWDYAGVYADYGKSGTSTRGRTDFMRMIEDCRLGRIDLIITKSVTRFARNTLDCLEHVRELKALVPQVGVYFEREKIHTLDPKNELLLTILSSLAQEEARNISENTKWSIQKNFQAGKPRLPTKFLLGYDKDDKGNLVINQAEAKTVRRVFREYMEGKGAKLIAKELKAEGIIGGRGKATWGKSSILHMLKNERYCGDVLMQKVFSVDYLTHKCKENKGQLPQYYIENHHPAIIPRAEWDAVQAELKRRYEMSITRDKNCRQGYSSVSVLSNRLFCGHCGQPLNRCSMGLYQDGKRQRQPAWRCRATSKKARKRGGYEPCKAKTQQERRLKNAFIAMLADLGENMDLQTSNGKHDSLVGTINAIQNYGEFKDEYFQELVEKALVYDNGQIDYVLKNGLIRTVFMSNDIRKTTQ